ncbi:MAG: HD domain-containing protein [Peptococcaceae bacterium]|nr:HD domain-containing protein [Peptococcaceae bacterium]
MEVREVKGLADKYGEEFISVAEPIFSHELYQSMKDIAHHDDSVYDHCLKVAYYAYRVAKRWDWDVEATIRGALLHDFHLYQFTKRPDRNILMEGLRHSRRHPKQALENAAMCWDISSKEKDIIVHHMFPFAIPRCREAWLISFADKFVAAWEYSSRAKRAVLPRMRMLRQRI